jgi:hypothetical protein
LSERFISPAAAAGELYRSALEVAVDSLPEPDELTDIVRGAIIGRYWPPNLQSDDAIESHIRAVVAQLEKCPLLDVGAGLNSYGSGFASYVHVFCTKAHRAATVRRDDRDWIDGIALYLGRLVPFAAFGAEQRTRHARGASGGFLDCQNLETTPDSSWEKELSAILGIVNAAGYAVIPKSKYCRPLPVRLEWETNFGTETYFDAIFYWYD